MEMVSLVPKGGQWASPGTMSFLLAFLNYSWSWLNSLGSRHWDGDRTAEKLCKKKKKKEEVWLHKQSCQARMQKLRTWCYLCQAVGSSRARSLWWRGSELGGSVQAFAIQPCSSSPSGNCALGSETAGWPPTSDWILYRERIWARQFYFIHTCLQWIQVG